MSFTYLASPYTHTSLDLMQQRYNEVMAATHWLLKHRIWVYSPIVHCHELAIRYRLPRDAKFWQAYNTTMLLASWRLLILTLPNWQDSVGVEYEMEVAEKHSLPINFLSPTTYKIHKQRIQSEV
jgi:hypothetical protein